MNEYLNPPNLDPKIIILNLNPCIDIEYSVPSFKQGGHNRVDIKNENVAGKGINVAVLFRHLKRDPLLIGFNFTGSGSVLTQYLDEKQVRHDLIDVPGRLRTNIKLYEQRSKQMTELNQKGSPVTEVHLKALENKLAQYNQKDTMLVINGSLPEGMPPQFIAKIHKNWKGDTVLDLTGDALKLAIKEKAATFIKPNLFELESTFNVNANNRVFTAIEAMRLCMRYKVRYTVVTLGADGALIATNQGAVHIEAPKVNIKSLQGAGDALLIGLIEGYWVGGYTQEMLQLGMSVAAAKIECESTELPSMQDIFTFMQNCPEAKPLTDDVLSSALDKLGYK